MLDRQERVTTLNVECTVGLNNEDFLKMRSGEHN